MAGSPITIYHNPRCSKSRATLQRIEDRGLHPTIVEYLKTPPTVAELDMLCTALGVDPAEMVRFNEQEAKDLGLKKTDTRLRADWLNLLAEYPRLIERPIVLRGEKAVIGRPPENVEALL